MNFLAFLVCLMLASTVQAVQVNQVSVDGPVKVAVIDTGFDFDSNWNEHLAKFDNDGFQLRKPKTCKQGHADFSGEGIKDTNGHGTHVSGIIAKFAEDADYCLVILKYFTNKSGDTIQTSIKALQRAVNLRVNIINYSGGGTLKSDAECGLIRQALDMGIIVVAAAGNERSNINKLPYYPAMCDSRVVAVSNSDDIGNLIPSSNFTDKKKGSKELVEEKGINILSLLPNNAIGTMSGTSQSAPTYTGKLIKKLKTK